MKLATFTHAGATRVGLVDEETVVEVGGGDGRNGCDLGAAGVVDGGGHGPPAAAAVTEQRDALGVAALAGGIEGHAGRQGLVGDVGGDGAGRRRA